MSEEDLLADRKFAVRLYETRYQVWKRHNIHDLHEIYEKRNLEYRDDFDKFCRKIFNKN